MRLGMEAFHGTKDMDISRVKVCNGDLVIITVPEKLDWRGSQHVKDMFANWLKKRGLTEVDCQIISGNDKFAITVLTVNDPFDEEVLGKK